MAVLRAWAVAVVWVGLAVAQQEVSIATEDGARIVGDVYGKGNRGVVLAHGGRFDRHSWKMQAEILTQAGFRVLAIDFRGEGKPAGVGPTDAEDRGRHFDILAAVHYLRRAGAKSVSVVGASMGGDYAAEAAEVEPAAMDRLVLLASGAYTPLAKMPGRKLFILSREDANGEGPRLPRIRAQYEKAMEPKQMVVVEGSAHAQFLFDTDQGERVMREILRFLSAR